MTNLEYNTEEVDSVEGHAQDLLLSATHPVLAQSVFVAFPSSGALVAYCADRALPEGAHILGEIESEYIQTMAPGLLLRLMRCMRRFRYLLGRARLGRAQDRQRAEAMTQQYLVLRKWLEDSAVEGDQAAAAFLEELDGKKVGDPEASGAQEEPRNAGTESSD